VSVVVLIVAVLAGMSYVNFVVNREPMFKVNAERAFLTLTSPAFENGATIPQKYTAQGENINPPLSVTGVPEGTASLVIIVDDPVFPLMIWNHWIIWNVPSNGMIAENTTVGVQGRNSWRENNYGGLDPPFGTHSYYFKVYALDITLNLSSDATKSDVLRAMDNHVLAKAELVGKYW
jgi:Raf kinase inhibitor-like YbhB/YbcL family protein